MDSIKLIAIIFGATGFWKFIEVLLKLRLDKKRTKAETHQIFEQANTQILGNWVVWSQKLEEKVRVLETEHSEMEETIMVQQNRIIMLEKHVEELKETNTMILKELKLLKQSNKEKHGI